jgi:hypothetical protein
MTKTLKIDDRVRMLTLAAYARSPPTIVAFKLGTGNPDLGDRRNNMVEYYATWRVKNCS